VSLSLPVLQSLSTPEDAPRIVEVAFKGTHRDFFHCTDPEIRVGDYVVVEVERGRDLGRVRAVGGVAVRKCSSCSSSGEGGEPAPTARVARRAERAEVEQLHVLRVDEDRVRRATREMVEQHDLKMKVSDAEWQWDRNKLTIYFTAERRVDFRQLVRDLARTFRTRIELKQIGVRDEAALLGGVGRCGRELCCSTWLREIKPISLQLAKDQGLSLNPSQISGTCGRLMCCLTYEHDAYLQARKRFPREGKTLRTAQGQEKVLSIDIWKELVTLQDEARQRRVVKLDDLRAEIAAAGTGAPPREREAAAPRREEALPEPADPRRPPRRPRGRGDRRPN